MYVCFLLVIFPLSVFQIVTFSHPLLQVDYAFISVIFARIINLSKYSTISCSSQKFSISKWTTSFCHIRWIVWYNYSIILNIFHWLIKKKLLCFNLYSKANEKCRLIFYNLSFAFLLYHTFIIKFKCTNQYSSAFPTGKRTFAAAGQTKCCRSFGWSSFPFQHIYLSCPFSFHRI